MSSLKLVLKRMFKHLLVMVILVLQSVCVYLCSADPDDPGWRDDDSSMGPQGTAFLNLLQHETRHLVVILKHKTSNILGQGRAKRTICVGWRILKKMLDCTEFD